MFTTATQASAPVATAERMTVLDAVRGVAVLGILVINVVALSGYAFTPPASHVQLPLAAWDAATWFALAFLVEAKFYSLFSFLFGVGFAVFVQRAAARGADPRRLFKRRLVGLAIIGLVHTLLIWYGDILLTYALIGFALVPFLGRDDRSVLRWATGLLVAPIVLYGLMVAVAGQPPPPATSAEAALPPVMMGAVEKFAHGNYIQVVQGNIVFAIANAVRRLLLMFFPRVLGMFLLGFYAGRRNMFADLRSHDRLFRKVAVAGCAIGLPLSLFGALWGEYSVGPPNINGLVETVVKSIGVPALALGYAAGLCLLFQRLPRLMVALAPAGRMALTNYLMHSVAALIIFYSFGFGLFGRVSLTVAVAGALAFFALQIVISRWWLARAQFGPAEWLWRAFTYRRRFPLLRD